MPEAVSHSRRMVNRSVSGQLSGVFRLPQLFYGFGGVLLCKGDAVVGTCHLAGGRQAVLLHQIVQLFSKCGIFIGDQFQMPQKKCFSYRNGGVGNCLRNGTALAVGNRF